MSTKVQDIRDRARDEIAEAEWAEAMNGRTVQRAIDEAVQLGAVNGVMAVGRTLTLGAFQKLRKFIDGETYKALGYNTAVEFLNSERSPLTKNQYYDRLSAITREGAEVFDLLNAMDISMRNRKLLAAGEIRIEGEEIVVGHEDHEERMPIADRLGIKTLISTLVEKATNSQEKTRQLEKKVAQGQKDFDKLKHQLAEAQNKAALLDPSASEIGQDVLRAAGILAKLKETLSAAAPEERDPWREAVFELLHNNQLGLSEVFGAPKREKDGVTDDLTDSDISDIVED